MRCTLSTLRVHTPLPSPYSVALARRSTSSICLNGNAEITGPKISSRAMAISSLTSANTVGATKKPSARAHSLSRMPPAAGRAPDDGLADFGGTGEGLLVPARMGRQRRSGSAEACHHIDHARRDARLEAHLAQAQRRQRRPLRRLVDPPA